MTEDMPAGWYRDVRRPSLHRFWNGQHWADEQPEADAERRPGSRFAHAEVA